MKDLVFRMRYEMIAEELGEMDPASFPDKRERDDYDRYAEQYLFYTKSGEVMGCFRLIYRTPIGLPAIKVYELDELAKEIGEANLCEMSRVYIKKEFRSVNTTLNLFTRIMVFGCRFMRKKKMTHAICAVEELLYRLIRLSNAPFKKVGDARPNYIRYRYPLLLSMEELAS